MRPEPTPVRDRIRYFFDAFGLMRSLAQDHLWDGTRTLHSLHWTRFVSSDFETFCICFHTKHNRNHDYCIIIETFLCFISGLNSPNETERGHCTLIAINGAKIYLKFVSKVCWHGGGMWYNIIRKRGSTFFFLDSSTVFYLLLLDIIYFIGIWWMRCIIGSNGIWRLHRETTEVISML